MNGLFNPEYIVSAIPAVIQGIPNALLLTFLGFSLGSLIGFGAALVKIRQVPFLKNVVAIYVSAIRGTPLLVQIFIAYYGVPIIVEAVNHRLETSLEISRIPAMVFVVIAFALNSGAYLTETFRSAILSVESGQLEAAHSVGMSSRQAMTRIVLPQALKAGLPNIANQIIMMLKDTSLAFTTSVLEIMGQAKIYAGRTSMFLESYIAAALVYWVLCFFLVILTNRIEARVRRNEIGVAA